MARQFHLARVRPMPIRFQCVKCKTRMRVPDATEGRKVKCPRCGESQRVPGERRSEIAETPAPPRDQPVSRERSDARAVDEPPAMKPTVQPARDAADLVKLEDDPKLLDRSIAPKPPVTRPPAVDDHPPEVVAPLSGVAAAPSEPEPDPNTDSDILEHIERDHAVSSAADHGEHQTHDDHAAPSQARREDSADLEEAPHEQSEDRPDADDAVRREPDDDDFALAAPAVEASPLKQSARAAPKALPLMGDHDQMGISARSEPLERADAIEDMDDLPTAATSAATPSGVAPSDTRPPETPKEPFLPPSSPPEFPLMQVITWTLRFFAMMAVGIGCALAVLDPFQWTNGRVLGRVLLLMGGLGVAMLAWAVAEATAALRLITRNSYRWKP